MQKELPLSERNIGSNKIGICQAQVQVNTWYSKRKTLPAKEFTLLMKTRKNASAQQRSLKLTKTRIK
jgi:hypothetical protein